MGRPALRSRQRLESMRMNIPPEKLRLCGNDGANSDLLRTGAGNLARLGLTVCDLTYEKRSMTGGGTHATCRDEALRSVFGGNPDIDQTSPDDRETLS